MTWSYIKIMDLLRINLILCFEPVNSILIIMFLSIKTTWSACVFDCIVVLIMLKPPWAVISINLAKTHVSK